MSHSNSTVTEAEVHKYVDGELPDARSRVVAEYVADDAQLKKQVDQYRAINRNLHQLFDDRQNEELPPRLLLAAAGEPGSGLWRIAASILWLAIGGVLGYLLHGQMTPSGYIRPLQVEAAFAHTVYVPEIRHPVEVGAAEQAHLNAWLSKRLDRQIAAPDLRDSGYALIGGRLLPDGHRAAAQFMYEDDTGERMTLYIRHAVNARESAFLHAETDGLGIVYWVDEGLAYALTATADRQKLTRIATVVYREFNP